MGARTVRAWYAAAAPCLLPVLAVASGFARAQDVINKHPLIRVAAGVLAIGFVVTGAYYIHRRRAGLGMSLVPGRPRLPKRLGRLSPEQFYARLLDAVRDGLARSTAHRIRSLSPGDLAEPEVLPAQPELRARWREVCSRATETLLGRAHPDEDQMARDLDVARDLLVAVGHRPPAPEDEDDEL